MQLKLENKLVHTTTYLPIWFIFKSMSLKIIGLIFFFEAILLEITLRRFISVCTLSCKLTPAWPQQHIEFQAFPKFNLYKVYLFSDLLKYLKFSPKAKIKIIFCNHFQSHSTNGNSRSFRRTSSIAAACPIILNSKLPNGNGYTGNGNVGRLDALEDLPCEKVSREVYIYYLKALGASPVSFAMVLYVLYQVHCRLKCLGGVIFGCKPS